MVSFTNYNYRMVIQMIELAFVANAITVNRGDMYLIDLGVVDIKVGGSNWWQGSNSNRVPAS